MLVAVLDSVAVGLAEASAVASVVAGVSETAVTEGVNVVVAVRVVVAAGVPVAGAPTGPARRAAFDCMPLAATGDTGPSVVSSIDAMTTKCALRVSDVRKERAKAGRINAWPLCDMLPP